MEKEYIFHGVGKSQLVFPDGSFLNINESQDLTIATSATTVEVEGGDSLYALETFVSKKATKLTITNAKFGLQGVKAATGSTVATGAEVWMPSDIKTVATAATTLSKTTGVVVESVVAKVVETGEFLTRVTGTPDEGKFAVTTLGAVTVDASLNGKSIEFSYTYTVTTGEIVNMLEDDVPGNCQFRHTLVTDQQDDNKRYQITIVAYRAKGTGSYQYDAKRGAAFAPKLEFDVLDAGRLDKKVMFYSIEEYVA